MDEINFPSASRTQIMGKPNGLSLRGDIMLQIYFPLIIWTDILGISLKI